MKNGNNLKKKVEDDDGDDVEGEEYEEIIYFKPQ